MSIETHSLTKRFKSYTAVDHLNFGIEEGEIFGILGPNGAGKTTTVRMLACIIAPSEGSAKVAGFDITKDPNAIRKTVGILTENPSLYEKMTAVENLEFFARAYGMKDRQAVADRIKEILEFFQLWERRNERVATFSKGMKQKLAIARSIVHDPEVLFLDEPTANLDPESSKLIRDLIDRLGRIRKHTVLLCTHRLEDAEKLCTKIMIVNRGTTIIIGTIDELRYRIAGKPKLEVRLRGTTSRMVETVKLLDSVESVDVLDGGTRLIITATDAQGAAPYVVRALVDEGAMLTGLGEALPSLEETYLKLVKGGIE